MSRSSKRPRPSPRGFIWQQMNIQFRMRALSLFSFGLLVFQPGVFSAVGYLLARMAGKSTPDLIHVIIGGGIMGLWSSLVFTSFYDISNDRREGTLELIVGSPTSFTTVLAVKTMTNVLTGSISMLLSFVAAKLFFNFSIPVYNLPSYPDFVVDPFFRLLEHGTLSGTFSRLVTRHRDVHQLS